MTTTYKETRILYKDDLRNLCIKHNWYTCGTCKEYSVLLDKCEKDNITTGDIVDMAEDILSHSCTDHPITSICFEIARICNSCFEEL